MSWLLSLLGRALFSRTGIALLLAGAVACFAGWGYQLHKRALIKQGYDQAMAQVQQAEAIKVRELLREYSRLVERVNRIQHDYQTEQARVADFRQRLRAADHSLRQQAADFADRLATASAESLRRYAEAADGDIERCIGHLERFAGEAASCAAAAHALNDAAQASTTTTPPQDQPAATP